jgi:hypothetical protein
MRASTHIHVLTAIPEQLSPAVRSNVTDCFATLTHKTCGPVPATQLEISGEPTLSLALAPALCTQVVNGTVEQQAPCDRSDSEAITLASSVTTLEAVIFDLNASFAQIDELFEVRFTCSVTDLTQSRQNGRLVSHQVAPLNLPCIWSSFPELASQIIGWQCSAGNEEHASIECRCSLSTKKASPWQRLSVSLWTQE